MEPKVDHTRASLHKVFAVFVFLVSLVVYALTVQRTLSLWDCGEFIACSYILGVAHPPGTPLFLLIGRIFSLLPVVADISLRVNLLSVVSGAAAAAFAYLVSVRLLFFLPQVKESSTRRLAVYFSSASGALLLAFSRTNWLNSVEAEVYSLSMMLIFLLIWLSLRWNDIRGTKNANNYLILIAYLGVMSIGIHMTVFLVMPAIFLFIVLADESLRRDIRFWISGILLFSISMDVMWFLCGVTAWLLISLIAYLNRRTAAWGLALFIGAVALIGYSNHAYIPIRAAQKPAINENNPDNLKKFIDYVARRQYGTESMLTRMFERRGSWANQLGDFPRIGFGGFLLKQYGFPGFAFLLPLVLAVIGIINLIKWKWKVGVYITLLLLICTIGLVLYMNFADGSAIDRVTGNNKLEVRDRDYFFTPGFVLFALCIGLGLYVVLNRIIKLLRDRRTIMLMALMGFHSLLLPLAALRANYECCDRSGLTVARDYAYNLLMSCPHDAILFTNGDNDTFPVWCLQEVYGIRRDVRVANLSLLQTDWYQLQMKYEWDVPISFDDDQMIWVEVYDNRIGHKIQRPVRPYVDHLRGDWVHPLMAFQDPETGRLVTVAHQMIENIIAANKWKYPILFANTYPEEVKYPLADHVIRRAWLYQLVPEKIKGAFAVDTTFHLMENVFCYDGLDNPQVYRDPVATALVVGAAQNIMEFADYLEGQGDTVGALRVVDFIMEKVPEFWQPYARKAAYLGLDQAATDTLFTRFFAHTDSLTAYNPDNVYYHLYRGMTHQYLGRRAEAATAYKEAYRCNRAINVTYRSLLSAYLASGRRADAVALSQEFLKTNPYDPTAAAVVSGKL